jgi:hypothetical protein
MSQHDRKPRLDRIRAEAYKDDADIDQLVKGFVDWSTYKEYLVFRIENRYTLEKRWRAVQASKRGNEVYAQRLRKRLRLLYNIPEVHAFDHKDRSKNKTTSILLVTLTYRRDRSLQSAWSDCGRDDNRFMASMRKRFGEISVIRSFEAQRDGFPHIHLLLFFHEYEFEAFHYGGKWRIHDKDDVESRWPWGFVDVQAISSLRSGISYVVKYLNKAHLSIVEDGADSKLVLTLAMLSIFRKRAFSISGSFKSIVGRRVRRHLVQQVDLHDMEPVDRWFLVGFWGGDLKLISVDLSYADFFKIRSSTSFNENRHLC